MTAEKMSPTDRAIKEQQVVVLQAELAADDALPATGQGDPGSAPEVEPTENGDEPKATKRTAKAKTDES